MNNDNIKSEKQVNEKSKMDPGNLLLILYMCLILFLVILGGMLGTSQAGSEDGSSFDLNTLQQEELRL